MIGSLTIGILALHGAFKEHKSFLTALYPEINVIFVKNEEQLLKSDGLMSDFFLLFKYFLKIH